MRRAEAVLVGLLGLAVLDCSGGAPPEQVGPRYRSVKPGVAFEMLRDNPDLVVLDVRPFEEFSGPEGHLERALSVPLPELDLLWSLLGISNEDTVLIYCGDGGQLQVDAARALIARGLRFVVQIDGGLDAWLRGDFAVFVEDAPLSPLRRQ